MTHVHCFSHNPPRAHTSRAGSISLSTLTQVRPHPGCLVLSCYNIVSHCLAVIALSHSITSLSQCLTASHWLALPRFALPHSHILLTFQPLCLFCAHITSLSICVSHPTSLSPCVALTPTSGTLPLYWPHTGSLSTNIGCSYGN